MVFGDPLGGELRYKIKKFSLRMMFTKLAALENGLKGAFSPGFCGRFTVFMPPVGRPTVLFKYSPALLLRDVVELEQVIMAVWNALRVHVLRSPLNAGPFWCIDFDNTLSWNGEEDARKMSRY